MINIALISHTAAFAGAERMLYNLACLLKKDDLFRPIVFLPGTESKENHFKEACDQSNITVVWVGDYSGYMAWYIYDKPGGGEPDRKRFILQAVQELKKQLAYYSIDMVICNTATSLVPAIAGAELEIPVVTWVHGIMDSTLLPGEYSPQQRLLYDRILLALSAQGICCSDWVARFYQSLSLCPMQVVHNWTLDEAGRNEKIAHKTSLPDKDGGQSYQEEVKDSSEQPKFNFVCLNTFEDNKGLDTLLEAADILVKKYHVEGFKVDLYGAGAPAFTENMLKFIEKHDLSDLIYIHKRTDNIGKVYDQSSCLVQPSRIESFGMTLIEAMSHSRPVIATKSGGPSEIVIDGKTGYLLERNNSEAMAEKMAYFMENPEIAQQMGRAGRERYIKCFSEEAARKTIIPLLKNAYDSYTGVTAAQQLILDITLHQLAVDAGNAGLPMTAQAAAPVVPYNPDELCFSGILSKKRQYGITGQAGTVSQIGILLANLGGDLSNGSLTLNLYQNGKLLASSERAGIELNMEGWTYFVCPPTLIDAGPLVIELCPEGFDGLGVFELREKRGFVYKVFNKLGCPLKGRDVLKACLLP